MPLIFHIPHASTHIPAHVRAGIELSDAALAEEVRLLTDHHTDVLFGAAVLDNDLVVRCPVSRLITDVERYPVDEDEPMSLCGMGAVYLRGHDGRTIRSSLAERDALMRAYYHPHHRTLAEAVQTHLDYYDSAFIIDCHSFPTSVLPYEHDPQLCRPQICIGTDPFHTPEDMAQVLDRSFTEAGYSVLRNTPFAGALVPLTCYRKDKRVRSVMIELRRDIYMDEATAQLLPLKQRVERHISLALENMRRLTY